MAGTDETVSGPRTIHIEAGKRDCASYCAWLVPSFCFVARARRLHFLEVLHSLAARVAGTQLPKAKEAHLLGAMARAVPSVLRDPDDHGGVGAQTLNLAASVVSILTAGLTSGLLGPHLPHARTARKAPQFLAAHYHAALHVQAAVRGFLKRHDESKNPKARAARTRPRPRRVAPIRPAPLRLPSPRPRLPSPPACAACLPPYATFPRPHLSLSGASSPR